MKRAVFAAGVFLLATGTATAAGIKEGKWSMTTVIQAEGMDAQAAAAMKDMENMPPEQQAMMQQMMGGMNIGAAGGKGMSITHTQCVTNDNPVPQGKDEEGCKQTHSLKGNAVNFEVVCDNSRSTGQVTYDNDSMKGTIKSTQTERGRPQEMTIDISGQYLGPCE